MPAARAASRALFQAVRVSKLFDSRNVDELGERIGMLGVDIGSGRHVSQRGIGGERVVDAPALLATAPWCRE